MASEFDRARTIVPYCIPLIDLHRWKPEIINLLDEIGFFKLLAIQRPGHKPPQQGIETVQFRTGRVVARTEASDLIDTLARLLLTAMPGMLLDETVATARMQLFGALQEATENTCDHAYVGQDTIASVQRWWMTGAVDGPNRHLNLIVYDQGWSIPATLPGWQRYGWIESRLARARRMLRFGGPDAELDAIKMRLPMDVPRSSTGLSHRGKGFPAFKFVVEQAREGRLRIVSRRGEFIYEKGRRPLARDLKTPLNGTLVEWDLWL